MILVPQCRRFFLLGTEDLVIVGDQGATAGLQLFAEVLDGATVLSHAATPLQVEPQRELASAERPRYLNVHFSSGLFADMNGPHPERTPAMIAPYPSTQHGHSGSDWRLTVVGPASRAVVERNRDSAFGRLAPGQLARVRVAP